MYTARCFHCDWGLTHEADVVREAVLEHVNDCPGPVVALRPPSPSDGALTFTSHLRCRGCGLPTHVCACVRVD